MLWLSLLCVVDFNVWFVFVFLNTDSISRLRLLIDHLGGGGVTDVKSTARTFSL